MRSCQARRRQHCFLRQCTAFGEAGSYSFSVVPMMSLDTSLSTIPVADMNLGPFFGGALFVGGLKRSYCLFCVFFVGGGLPKQDTPIICVVYSIPTGFFCVGGGGYLQMKEAGKSIWVAIGPLLEKCWRSPQADYTCI